MKASLIISIGILITLLSCSSADDDSQQMPVSEGTIHPVEELISFDGEYADRVEMTRGLTTSDKELKTLVGRLRNAREMFTIGVREGADHQMIGGVGGITTNEEGNILLLDSENKEVRVYDSTGSFVEALGGPGQGPQELQAASVFDRRLDGTLVVGGLGPAKLFSPSFEHETTVDVGYRAHDLCLTEEHMFVRGFAGNMQGASEAASYIHGYSTTDGQPSHSFGTEYDSQNPLIAMEYAQGEIACSSQRRGIFSAAYDIPLVYAYESDGSVRWVSKLVDFQPGQIEETYNEGSPSASFLDQEVSDGINFMTLIPSGYLLVQTIRSASEEAKDDHDDLGAHTYIFSTETGEGTYVGQSIPPIYRATNDRLYAGGDREFPQVRVFEY